ncbi:hypothetical protein LCGC14_0326040 [marine sediment metagenome]|uniref:Uncharacterized protein n=1 Tax=marine sediment metagenome TaxID=412755 RepID=A0A0F9WQ06_9ZZZZ
MPNQDKLKPCPSCRAMPRWQQRAPIDYPRCETCEDWTILDRYPGVGYCGANRLRNLQIGPTPSRFGCVHHKPKRED